jgi:hypothetical protein
MKTQKYKDSITNAIWYLTKGYSPRLGEENTNKLNILIDLCYQIRDCEEVDTKLLGLLSTVSFSKQKAININNDIIKHLLEKNKELSL